MYKSLTDHDKPRIQNSLPPQVKGQLRCFLAVTVDKIKWRVKNHPKDIQVCLQWWGETGDGTMFWPFHGKKSSSTPRSHNTVLFPVCSGPKQFAAYVKDMNILILDVLYSKSLRPFGRVEIHDLMELTGSNPIDKWYPVMSRSVQPVIFADLHVVLKFEPVDVVVQELGTVVPVIDQDFKHLIQNNNDLEEQKAKVTEEKSKTNESSDKQRSEDVNGDDVIISLIKRGKTLRNSIMDSKTDLQDKNNIQSIEDSEEEQLERSVSGSLFQEILKFDETDSPHTSINIPVDLSDDNVDLLYESRSSIESDLDDPMHDETLLQDLFYVNKEISAVQTLNESEERNTGDVQTMENEQKTSDDKDDDESNIEQRKLSSVLETEISLKEENEEKAEQINFDHHTSSSRHKLPVLKHKHSKDFINEFGVNKLTALGRVTAARVHINNLNMVHELNIEQRNKTTYFIEYEFPVAANQMKNDVGLEITRIASKKTTSQSIMFNHHTVFPVQFDSTVIRFWCDCVLKVNIFERKSGQKSPVLIGYGKINVLNVLRSQHLQYEGLIQIYDKRNIDDGKSTQSSSETALLGELEIKVNLICNGKDLNYFSPEKVDTSSGIGRRVEDVKDNFSSENHVRVETKKISQEIHMNRKEIATTSNHHDSVPLTALLWVSEGRNIRSSGHGIRVPVPGNMTRSNFYLISRMFWATDTTRSPVVWGQNDPKFNFRQIFPVLLTSALLDRMHNNFLTLEVWSKTVGSKEDELAGIAKISLQQFYLSFKEERTTKALLKSKFPVVCLDGWVNIGNPFKGTSHGELSVLLAMGSENQINRLIDIKQCSDNHDHFKTRLQNDLNFSSKQSGENYIEHWFEISIECVKKLSAVGKTSLAGETDCFVQYNFPYQKPDTEIDITTDLAQDVPGLQNHRTATTVCARDTTFNDVSRYCIVLPQTLPVQRYLLAAYHGSWSAMSAVASLTFQLWKRSYYPNIRDQLVAKAVLPLSKLCGMITMKKEGESSIQSFSLPLIILPSHDDSKISEPEGHLDVVIKYRQSKLPVQKIHHFHEKNHSTDINSQVCLAIEVVRACGLKSALRELTKKDSSLRYASEIGGNPFVKIKLPFNIKMNERTTRTIAKTFTPEFGYRMEFILPLVMRDNIIGRDSQEFTGTLAECLEFGEIVFEIWHQRPQENNDVFVEELTVGHGLYHRQFLPTSDVLLGIVKIPLQHLLFSHTGLRGWFPIKSENSGWSNKQDVGNTLDKTLGGLEIIINLSESTAREKIIEGARAVGWSPSLWYELEDGEWLNNTPDIADGVMNVGQGLSLLVNVKKVWIPKVIVAAEQTRQGVKGDLGCYIRYKFYDTKAVFSSICGIKMLKDSDRTLCDLKHRHSYIVKTTPPFIWYIREERLEIQVWLTQRHQKSGTSLPHKRDKLLGSAFIALFPLLDGSKSFSQISGLFSLFRNGAVDLYGAGLHVQLVIHKPSSSHQTLGGEMDEVIASTETSVRDEKESLTIVSSDEDNDIKNGKNIPKNISTPSEDESDVITAHVVIEQALHLPYIKENQNKSIQPNVYITCQPKPDVKLIKTKTIHSTSSPVWDHEKIVKFNKTLIPKQMLLFKVWHKRSESDDDEDLLLGVASVDLSPLASGLRQVMGWYNIVDSSRQCQGQIKIGVVPLLSVSPARRDMIPHLNYDCIGEKTVDCPSMQPNKMMSGIVDHSEIRSVEVTDSSKSFLLRQLRQNLNDLDVIKDKLSQRLTANTQSLCMSNKSSILLKQTGESSNVQEPEKESNLEMACLTTSSVSDDDNLLKWTKDVPVIRDEMSQETDGEDNPESSLIHQTNTDRNDSCVHQTKTDSSETNNRNANTDDKLEDIDIDDIFKDAHDHVVTMEGHNSHEKYATNDNTGSNIDGLSYCNDKDHGSDNDSTSRNDSMELMHDHGNDNMSVVSHNEDVDTDDRNNCKDLLINSVEENKRLTGLVSEGDISNENAEHDNVANSENSGDESLDSFFDCVTANRVSKQSVEPPEMSDVVKPTSIVSRINLSKLRRIVQDDEQDLSLHKHYIDNNNMDVNCDKTVSFQPCADKKNSPVISDSDAVTRKDVDNEQQTQAMFQQDCHIETSMLHRLEKPSIPNFFMPPKDLEQSMRSLRLAATFRKQPKCDNSEYREKTRSTSEDNIYHSKEKVPRKSFTDWKKLQEIKTTGEIPLTSEETSRLARIFSSNYSTKE